MLDPDHASRVAPTHAPPAGALGENPHVLQILMTEHWSLLGARSLGYTESMARTTIFVAALTGSVVALALVGQATDFGGAFTAFALVLLPVVFFLGVVTIVRLSQVNWEDALWVQGMNRIRHAYLELAPELEPYFVTSRYDDDRGIVLSTLGVPSVFPPVQGFVAVPGVVAVLDSVVAGAIVGITAHSLDSGAGVAVALGGVAFAVVIALFAAFAFVMISRLRKRVVTRFPSPPDDGTAA
jgi:hypothetical protein